MYSYEEYKNLKLTENEISNTKISKIKTEISIKFDEINKLKEKKSDDPNLQVNDINKQSILYSDISKLLKNLSNEMKIEISMSKNIKRENII